MPPEASGKDTDISEIFASTFRYFAQPSLGPDPLDKLPRPAVWRRPGDRLLLASQGRARAASFAAQNATAQMVDELCAAIPSLSGGEQALKSELEAYRQAASNAGIIDHNDHKAFTEGVLNFWQKNGTKIKAWAAAAKIVFAIPPTSAASERVFSLLKAMFGDSQLGALGDYLEAALMLRYNKRSVG